MIENKASELTTLLQQEVNWIGELITILSDEKEALIKNSFASLENLSELKQALADKLEQSAGERVTLLGGETEGPQAQAALQSFLSQCSPDEGEKISQLNKQLAENLIYCRELNMVNGQVIITNLHIRQELFNSLKNQANIDKASTYTSSGDLKSSNESLRHQEA